MTNLCISAVASACASAVHAVPRPVTHLLCVCQCRSCRAETCYTSPVRVPGPFMPCRDLFDWWTLRCGVWIVFLLALLGNGTVVIVLCFSRSKMDVPRFLVANLALADFFMGIYLGQWYSVTQTSHSNHH